MRSYIELQSSDPADTAGAVTWVRVLTGGTGYTSETVTFSGGAGASFAATATKVGGVITRINITNGGTGFTSVPTVSMTAGAGSGATFEVFISRWYKARFMAADWRNPVVAPLDIQRDILGNGYPTIGYPYSVWGGTAKIKWTEDAGYLKGLTLRQMMTSAVRKQRILNIKTPYHDIATIDGIANPDYLMAYKCFISTPYDPQQIVPVHDGPSSFSYVQMKIEQI